MKFFKNIFVLFLGFSIYRFLGSDTRCIFKNTIGIPCPGCGMTRALEYFIEGEFFKAFYYNPLFLVPIFIAVFYLFRDNSFVGSIYNNRSIHLILVIVFLVVYVLRIFFMFPHTPPMEYNKPFIIEILNVYSTE